MIIINQQLRLVRETQSFFEKVQPMILIELIVLDFTQSMIKYIQSLIEHLKAVWLNEYETQSTIECVLLINQMY